MNDARCDALIVGGGPAGSSCAWALRRAGLDVCVLDKKEFPRDKVCAGWITPPVLEALQIDHGDYARHHVLQPITGFCSGHIGNRAIETEYADVISYGIRRREFDHYLLARSDAQLMLGEPLTFIERQNGNWLINKHIETPLLIGAGGHFCPVARHLGADVGSGEPTVVAREVEFLMSSAQRAWCRVAAERPELYFCADLKGYGWVFRKGNYLNIGLGREDPHRLSEHSADFIAWLKTTGRISADVTEPFKGHAYLLYSHGKRKLLDDGVLLVGDAAGLAYPHSGEGIRPAIESGLMAAETVIDANGDFGADKLESYRNKLVSRFGATANGSTSLIPESLRHFIGERLLDNRWLTRHVLLNHWFLHRHQPALKMAS